MHSLNYTLTRRQTLPIYSVMTLYAASAPVAVTSIVQHLIPIPGSVLLTFLALALFLVALFTERQPVSITELNRIGLLVCGAIAIPAIASLTGVAFALVSIQSVEYTAYVNHSLLNRLINLSLYIVLTFVVLIFIRRDVQQTNTSLLKGYTIGTFLLALGGIWQFLHFTIGYPMPLFDTRAYVHSVNQDVLFNFRITSFTDEPSFLVPFLLDGLIIGTLIMTRKTYALFASLTILVLLLTFSISGYVNVVVIGLVAMLLLFTRNMIPKKMILTIIGGLFLLITTLFLLLPQAFIALFMPILGRVDGLFDVMHHSRLYMLVFPFVWLFDYSFMNTLFGFGPGSYDFLARTKFLSHQGAVSGTSNNVFVDLLFEHGLLGGLLFTMSFIAISFYLWKKRNIHLYYSIALILWIHLGVTSLYRADFASPRFWLIIMIVVGLLELARQKRYLPNHVPNIFQKAKVTSI
ncbi:O-antigen ligase family protein [Shouchella miscanthi]|uniref:O-antigen ligase family protein n=1 Tax=Shouchella miscanthi TaxID=2598861 RepID=UPI00119DBF1A|nr:hypothetical protein [Shouchella miscanthi]